MKRKIEVQLAQIISSIFNPGLIWLLILVLAVFLSPMRWDKLWIWVSIIVFFNGLLPLTLYLILKRFGYEIDSTGKDAKSRSQRAPLIRLMVLVAVLEIVVSSTHNPVQPLQAVLFASVIIGLLATIINNFWKISLHTMISTLAFFSLVLMLKVSFFYLILVTIFLMLICWSRLILERHTWKQVFAAFFSAAMITVLTFWQYGLLGS